jgi:hypothetical protein
MHGKLYTGFTKLYSTIDIEQKEETCIEVTIRLVRRNEHMGADYANDFATAHVFVSLSLPWQGLRRSKFCAANGTLL